MGVKFKKEGDWADGVDFSTAFDPTIPSGPNSIAIPAGQTLDQFLGNPGPPSMDTPGGGMNAYNPFPANTGYATDSGVAAYDMYAQQDAENQMGGFSPVVQNTVANVFDNRANNNARGGYTPVGEDIEGQYGFEDLAAQPTADQILNDPNRTNEQKVDELYDLYPGQAPGLILGRANEAEMTAQGVSDSYRDFPVDVLTTILQTMGNQGNQDAIDILARSKPIPPSNPPGNQNGNQTGNQNPGNDDPSTNPNVIIGGNGTNDGQTPIDDTPKPDENGQCPVGFQNVDGQCVAIIPPGDVDVGDDDPPQETFVCGAGTLREGETVTSLDLCNIPKGDDPPALVCPVGTLREGETVTSLDMCNKPKGDPPPENTCEIVGGVQYVRDANGVCVPPGGDPGGGPYEPDDDPPGTNTTVVPKVTPEIPAAGNNMGFGDFQSTFERNTEADQELRRRSMNLLGSGPQESLMQRYNQGLTPFSGQRFTGLNQDQINANEMLRGNVSAIPGQNIFNQATAAAQGLAPIQANTITGPLIDPEAIQTGGRQRIQDIVAQQFAGTNLAPYTNPYDQQVVDAALNDIERQRQMALQQNASQATLAGAYGGDRAALIDAETNRAALDTAARTAASLRQQGFNDAAARVESDANRAMSAAQSNQAADQQTVRDALSVASDNLQANMSQQRAADTDTQLNQIRQSQALLDAFGQGSDIYRQYLGDFVGLGDRLDARDQRELDFDFGQYLLGQEFDQDQITNLLNLIQRAPQNTKITDSVDAGVTGDLAALSNIYNIGSGIYDFASGIGGATPTPTSGGGLVGNLENLGIDTSDMSLGDVLLAGLGQRGY